MKYKTIKLMILLGIFMFSLNFLSATWSPNLNTDLFCVHNFTTLNASFHAENQDNLTVMEGNLNISSADCKFGDCYGLYGGNILETTNQTIPSDTNKTISLWFKQISHIATVQNLFFRDPPKLLVVEQEGIPTNESWYIDNWALSRLRGVRWTQGEWNLFTLTMNDTSACAWMNGTLSVCGTPNKTRDFGGRIFFGSASAGGASDFIGWVDEFYTWNRTLTPDEIDILWSDSFYGSESAPEVTLNSPINNTNSYLTNLTLNCSAEDIGFGSVVNLSLVIDGAINETITNTTSPSNLSIERELTFVPGAYTWTCISSDENDNQGTTQTRFFTINNTDPMINSQTYNTQASGGSLQNFSINLSYDGSYYSGISVRLSYNNTNYSASTDDTDNVRVYSRQVPVPNVLALTNKSFHWIISLTNISGTFDFYSNNSNQSVGTFLIDDCSSYTRTLLNFSMYDEESLEERNGTINVNINIYSHGTTNLVNSYNKSFNHLIGTDSSICLQNITEDYTMAYEIQYYVNSSYFRRYKNIQAMTINNLTLSQNISLYNLLISAGETFEVIVVGNLLSETGNANLLVDTQRQYLHLSEFKSVESSITSSDGVAITHLVESDEVYNFILSYNGETLGSFNNYRVKCENEATGQCSITLNLAEATGTLTDFENFGNISQIFLLDRDTNILHNTFTSTDGQSHLVRLLLIKDDGYANTTICNNTATGTSGTIQCPIPVAHQNVSFFAQTFVDGNYIGSKHFSQGGEVDWYGADVFIMLLMFSALVLLLVGHPITIVIGAVVGLFSPVLLLYVAGGSFTIVIGAVLFYLAGGIIAIWQISRKI